MRERHDWPGSSAIGKVVTDRCLPDSTESIDTRHHLLSAKLSPSASVTSSAPTGRFEIADARIGRLHWVLDVSMDEDPVCNRKGNSAPCLVIVRGLGS